MSYLDRLVAEHDQDIDDIYVELQRLQRNKSDKPAYDYRPWHYYNTVDYPRKWFYGDIERYRSRTRQIDDYVALQKLKYEAMQEKQDRLKNQALRAEYV